jgi:hypothetical protein
MSQCDLATEESDWTVTLMEHWPHVEDRGVAFQHEITVDIWQLQHRRRSQRPLQGVERRLRLIRPVESCLVKKPCQGFGDDVVISDEAPIIVREAEKAADGAHRCLHLGRVHSNAVFRDNVAEVGHDALTKGALGSLDEEGVLLQLGEDNMEVAEVLRPRQVVYKDVIEKYKDEPVKEGSQHVIHQCLECRGCIRLLHVARVHAHLVIAGAEVELGEELGATQFVGKLLNHWNRELIFDCLGVQGVVVNAEPLGAVTFLDEEDRCGKHRQARADDPLAKHLNALVFQLLFLMLCVPIQVDDDGWHARQESYLVAPLARWWKSVGLDEQ